MKTRYAMIEKAGDLLDSASKLLGEASEPDLAEEVHKLVKKLHIAQDAAIDPKDLEPELDGDLVGVERD